MFELGKILTFVVHPARLAFLLLCLGVALLFTRRWRIGRSLIAGLLLASLVLGTVPVGDWLLHKLEHRFPRLTELPADADGIVLLGGEIHPRRTLEIGQPVIGRAARLLGFAVLARRYPDARLVFTGGSGQLFERTAEADAIPVALRAVGLAPERVEFEGKSRNTYENAVFTRDLARPQPGETWILVTSAAHMPRAVGVFRAAGFPVIPYPVDYVTPETLTWSLGFTFDTGFRDLGAALKEWMGLTAYRLFGYTDELFPAP